MHTIFFVPFHSSLKWSRRNIIPSPLRWLRWSLSLQQDAGSTEVSCTVIGIAFHCLHSPRRTAGCRRTCHGFSLHTELILLLQLPAWTVSTPLFNFFRLTCSPVILLHNPNTRLSPVLVSSGSPKSSTPDLSLGSKGVCTCLNTVSLNLVNSSFPSIKRKERCGPTGSLT